MFLFRQFLPKPQHFILSFTQSRKPDNNIYIFPVQTLTNRRNLSGQALSIKHPGNESLQTQFCFVKHLVMKSCQKALLKNQFAVVIFFLSLAATVSICKVGDCGLRTYQTVTILKRLTTAVFTTITPILYIHCCQ